MRNHRSALRPARWQALIYLLPVLAATPALKAEMELAPYAGFRMAGEFEVRDSENNSTTDLSFRDSESFGMVLNVDLDQPGKQLELYAGRQQTTASSDVPLAPGTTAVDITLYQLQFGGLYFPGGRNTGGFVSGVAGITRLDPEPSGLDDHHRAALSLGGGYKLALTDHLLARFDLRGIYTVLDSGGAIFCDGGCRARFESSGYLQVEASAGLAIRF